MNNQCHNLKMSLFDFVKTNFYAKINKEMKNTFEINFKTFLSQGHETHLLKVCSNKFVDC